MKYSIKTARNWIFAAVVLLVLVVGILPAVFPQQTDGNAFVTHIEGFVDLKKVGGDEWVSLVEGYVPKIGDEIQTGSEGWVEITLKDSSLMKIGPDSYVVIKELGYFEVTKTSTSVIELVQGKVRAWVTPFQTKGAAFFIETENASIGVRGTDFGAMFDPDSLRTTIIGIESCVTVEYRDIPGAVTAMVCEDKMLDVITGEAPGAVGNIDPALLRQFLEEMSFSDVSGAGDSGGAGDPYIDRAFINNRIELDDIYEIIVNRSNISPTGEIEVNGTAADDSYPVSAVEYSLNGGLSWDRADGTENWRFSFIPEETREYELMLRAINSRGTSSGPYDIGPWTITYLDVDTEEIAKEFLDSFIMYLETENQSGLEDLISEEYDGNVGGYYSKGELISESIEPFFDGVSTITVNYNVDRVNESSIVVETTWNTTIAGFNNDGRTTWWLKGEDQYRLTHAEGDWLLGGKTAGVKESLELTYAYLNLGSCDHVVRVLLTVPDIPLNVTEVEVELEAETCASEYRTLTRSYYKNFTGSSAGFGGEFVVESVTNCTDPHLCGSESIMYISTNSWLDGYFYDYGYDLSGFVDLP
ncbi:MAG: FecR domain-containing protein [Deltaproteobacteria bacterium]|nr:FecR domain-containing protein [Candidatus Zymogenaceae bacterium]